MRWDGDRISDRALGAPYFLPWFKVARHIIIWLSPEPTATGFEAMSATRAALAGWGKRGDGRQPVPLAPVAEAGPLSVWSTCCSCYSLLAALVDRKVLAVPHRQQVLAGRTSSNSGIGGGKSILPLRTAWGAASRCCGTALAVSLLEKRAPREASAGQPTLCAQVSGALHAPGRAGTALRARVRGAKSPGAQATRCAC